MAYKSKRMASWCPYNAVHADIGRKIKKRKNDPNSLCLALETIEETADGKPN